MLEFETNEELQSFVMIVVLASLVAGIFMNYLLG